MSPSDWMQQLQPGDRVAFQGFAWTLPSIAVVRSVYADRDQLVICGPKCGAGLIISRQTGHVLDPETGQEYRPSIKPLTPELEQAIHEHRVSTAAAAPAA